MGSVLRLVFDTNALVSALLAGDSIPAQAFAWAESYDVLLASTATLTEFEQVLNRKKFDRYLSLEARRVFLRRYRDAAELVLIRKEIRACRDPRDDKFLELAVNGKANYILTGDEDLLVLDPFQKVRIVTPRAFLEKRRSAGKPVAQ